MDRDDLASRIDHTVLGPLTTLADARAACDAAASRGMNACVPPCYVGGVRESFPELTIATVIGFPHGQHDPTIKRREAVRAGQEGANELDLVPNVGWIVGDDRDRMTAELEDVVDAVSVPVKVIVRAPSLDERSLRRACEAAADAGAAMVKTATGFGEGGARTADVRLMAEYLPVKASGGIRDYDDATRMLSAGATRIGTSSGVAVLSGAPTD